MCLFVRSRTVMRYVPAATRAALRPAAVFRLIAAPGPTVPVRRFGHGAEAAAEAEAARCRR